MIYSISCRKAIISTIRISPEPATVLGFQLGRQHADWGQVVEYMKAFWLKPRIGVTLQEVGAYLSISSFIEVVITSPENQRNIEKIREEHLALTDVDRSTDLDIRKNAGCCQLGI